MSLKRLAKDVVKKTLIKSGGLATAVRIAPAGAVVLMYHSITEDPQFAANSIGVSQPRASFDAHVRTIAQRFAPVTIEQVAQFAKEGRHLPPKSVAVTFDDGFADNYDVALPVLSRYGVPATFYIMVNAVETGIPPWYCRLNFAFRTTKRSEWSDPDQRQSYKIESIHEREAVLKTAFALGARKTGNRQEEFVRRIEKSLEVEPLGSEAGLMLNWEKVRALNAAGHSIGGHTLSHPNLAHVTEEEARTEILGCKKRLEAEIEKPSIIFLTRTLHSIPNGVTKPYRSRVRWGSNQPCSPPAGLSAEETNRLLLSEFMRPTSWTSGFGIWTARSSGRSI